MTKSQELALERSRIRQRLRAIARAETMTDELRTEQAKLEDDFGDVELRYRSELIAEDKEKEKAKALSPDGEARELLELREKVSLGRYVEVASTAHSGGRLDGAEREYNQAVKVSDSPVAKLGGGAGVVIPLRLLSVPELRAKTDEDTNVNVIGWLDRIFQDTASRHLGIEYHSISGGKAVFPVTTAGGAPIARGREEAVTASSWTVDTVELEPSRISSMYEFNLEDSARNPGLESALERDLRSSFVETTDRLIFTGDSGANEATADIASFFDTTGITAKTLSQANKILYNEVLGVLVDLLDATHAESLSDLRVVSTVGWNQLLLKTIANSAADSASIAMFLRNNGLNWRVRGGVETGTADGDVLAAIGLGRGLSGSGVGCVWDAMLLVRDMYHDAPSGKIRLIMHGLWSYALLRPTNYAKLTAAA